MSDKTPNNRAKRPPVVVVMGHIDHGKSTLLDFIRKSNIVSGEAGGITQHVGAYQAEHVSSDGVKHEITFLDTPGHEAFCSIRERGALAADIAILVVSAEDGVKPQTIEAYREIKKTGIPYIVAINKIDKPNADVNRAKQSLGENEIYVEGWGGDIPCVAISALNGTGVGELLDMVILVSELEDLTTDPHKSAEGIVVESELDQRKGIMATLLIKDGTMHTGSFVVAGGTYSPIRYIEDFKGDKIEQATASMPVVIVGWNEMPACGEKFVIVSTRKEAEVVAASAASGVLPIIIKTDAVGSLDGVKHELAKIKNDKVRLRIVAAGVGAINENDVKVALGNPEIVIVGFNVIPDKRAMAVLERSSIECKTFKVIYELSQFVRDSLLAKVPKEYIEESTGRARVLAVFSKDKDRQVIGGKVESGVINTGNEIKIMRRGAEIGRGKVRELQEKKLRVGEVAEGHEFGVMIEAKIEIAVGDAVEAVRMIEKGALNK